MKLSNRPDKLVMASEVHPMRHFFAAVPLLLAALFLFGYWHGGMQILGQPAGPLNTTVSVVLFSAIGLALSFGRLKLVIDREMRLAYRWIGALVPIWKSTLKWSAVTEVALQTVRRTGNRRTYLAYKVVLKGHFSELSSPDIDEEHEARRLARQVAVIMGLPLRDTVKDTLTACQELRGGLRQRLSREPEKLSTVGPPPEGTRVNRVGSTLEVQVEPRGASFLGPIFFYVQVAGVLMIFGPLGYVVLLAAFSESVEPEMRLLALPWLAILVSGILWLRKSYWQMKRESEKEQEIRLTATELTWKETWRGSTVSQSVPTEEIEDLERDSRGVIVLTETESFHLASGAKRPLQSWLISALKSHLVTTYRTL